MNDCTHSSDTMAVSALQLGVYCGSGMSADYVKDDYFVECGKGDTYDNNYGPLCFSSIRVPDSDVDKLNATNTDTTVIMTDQRWSQSAPSKCYIFEETGSNRRLRLRSTH